MPMPFKDYKQVVAMAADHESPQIIQLDFTALRDQAPCLGPNEAEWVQCGLLEHHVLWTRLQAEHLLWVHQPAAVAPVLGKEQLETGVHQRRCALIDDSIGVDHGAWDGR